MSLTEEDYGREPFILVELYQPRCSLRFGVSPCMASGSPLCYQTWGSCKDRENITLDGSITWRFARPQAGILPLYEEDGEHIKTNPIYMLVSVSASSSELNVGAQREGQSPLGVNSSCSIVLQDQVWDDHVGDFNLAARSSVQGNFWGKWRPRNIFYTGMILKIYEGYRGQTLAEMQQRDYILESVNGPDSKGQVTLNGVDPLRLAQLKDAQFPRPTNMKNRLDILAADTAIKLIVLNEDDLTDDFGNTTLKYFRMSDEIIGYTSATFDADSTYIINGVLRGQLGTIAANHSADTAAQRVGRYENLRGWEISADLIDNHTEIPGIYRDAAEWEEEGENYLVTQRADRTIPSPTAVEQLLGELCQQFSFSNWWDERARKIKLLANRPQNGAPVVLSDRLEILADSVAMKEDRNLLVTRVALYYNPTNPFNLDKPENYKVLYLDVDGFIEDARAANTIKTLTIYANWITRDGDAIRLAARLLLRYRLPTSYMTMTLDAKHRALTIGAVFDITTGSFVDTEGRPLVTRWQAIKVEEPKSSHLVQLNLQSFAFLGRFGNIMPAAATENYVDATDDEKETGCYLADATTELMPNGDPPYLLQ